VANSVRKGRLDSVSIAGIAVFGALSVVLTTLSQGLGLNFPLVPYLQFDLGEIAILLAFFIFGPIPALVSSFIEFATLMAIGQNVAFFGPEFKLIAILSSLLGIWLGISVVSHMERRTVTKAAGLGGGIGMLFRAAAMTLPNYLLIVSPLFGIQNAVYTVEAPFKALGVTITDANVLVFILTVTAAFNALQLAFVTAVTYFVMRLPQVQKVRIAGKSPWIITYLQSKH
jgi:riboflavin transporter FmnP